MCGLSWGRFGVGCWNLCCAALMYPGMVGIGAAESRNEVCFPSLNGAFGYIASMGVWRDQLKVEVVVMHGFHCRGIVVLV